MQRDDPQIPQGGRGARRHRLEVIHKGYDLLWTQRPTGNYTTVEGSKVTGEQWATG
jgi:hypothetical protein